MTSMSLSLQSLGSSEAMCNDGSAAKMYVRTCCDGADTGDFCNNTMRSPLWLVVFGDGNDGWCWNEPSCARRSGSASSSKALPQYFSRDGGRDDSRVGVFSKSGEGNPNFYPSYTAFVPHCSSDLFLGNRSLEDGAPFFRGRSIAFAAIDGLHAQMKASAAEGPLRVVIAGGAGVMLLLDELRDRLPLGAQVSAVCDGCVLYDDDQSSDSACTSVDAFSCPPSKTLPQAIELWHAAASLESACTDGWRCLLDAPKRVKARPTPPPLLAQQPLYDAATIRAHPGSPLASVRARLTQAIEVADVYVGAACSRAPSASLTHAAFFDITFGGRRIPPPSYASALYSLMSGTSGSLIDTCAGADCNANCPSSSTDVLQHEHQQNRALLFGPTSNLKPSALAVDGLVATHASFVERPMQR